MTTLVDLITNLVGTYVPLNGSGIETINWPWLVAGAIWVLLIWFIFKLLLRLIDGSRK